VADEIDLEPFDADSHYSLGAALALVEGEVALCALLARFPGLSLAVPPGELRWRANSTMHGLESLPVCLA
jgi:cytochrome P450